MNLSQIPFMGFYYSWYDREIDLQIEAAAENRLETDPRGIPPHLKDKLNDIYQSCFSVNRCYPEISQKYVKEFNAWFLDEYEIDLGLKFESLQSPKCYNFETDRIFAWIDDAALPALEKLTEGRFGKWLYERMRARDGFIPHYSNSLTQWYEEKAFEDWDFNQLGLLLEFLFEGEGNDNAFSVFEEMFEPIFLAVSNAFDYDEIDVRIHEMLIEDAQKQWEKEQVKEQEDALYGDAREFPVNIDNARLYVEKYEELNHLKREVA